MVSPALLILDSYTSERLSPNQYSFLCMVLQILTTDYSLLIYSYIRYIQWLFLRYFYGSYSSLSLDELSAFNHFRSASEFPISLILFHCGSSYLDRSFYGSLGSPIMVIFVFLGASFVFCFQFCTLWFLTPLIQTFSYFSI